MQKPVQAGRWRPQETTSPNKTVQPWPHMMIPDQSQLSLKKGGNVNSVTVTREGQTTEQNDNKD